MVNLTLSEFLNQAATVAGINAIFGFILSWVVDWIPSWGDAEPRFKRGLTMLICLAVAMCLLALQVATTHAALTTDMIFAYLAVGFLAGSGGYETSQVAHLRKLQSNEQSRAQFEAAVQAEVGARMASR